MFFRTSVCKVEWSVQFGCPSSEQRNTPLRHSSIAISFRPALGTQLRVIRGPLSKRSDRAGRGMLSPPAAAASSRRKEFQAMNWWCPVWTDTHAHQRARARARTLLINASLVVFITSARGLCLLPTSPVQSPFNCPKWISFRHSNTDALIPQIYRMYSWRWLHPRTTWLYN